MSGPEHEVIAELARAVDELRHSVLGLSRRVGVLSASLGTVNELQRAQQDLGDKAIMAVEQANAIAVKLEEVKLMVVPREELDRMARVEVLRRRRATRRVSIALIAFLVSLYGTIFAVAPIENSLCVINGPRSAASQSVCNAVSPFESHPLGGRQKVALVLQEQINANNGRINQLEQQVAGTLALANAERAKRHLAPLPVLPDPSVGVVLDRNSPASRFDWSAPSAIAVDVVLLALVGWLLVMARRRDGLDESESSDIE